MGNETLIVEDDAAEIARFAQGIVKAQISIGQAEMMIETLITYPLADIRLEVSTLVRQESYPCQITNASAVALLRESIELKRQDIRIASDWLRFRLKE
jgi:hypothetical protein